MKNTSLFVDIGTQFHKPFLIFDEYSGISSQNDVSKANIKILLKQFDAFYFRYVFDTFDKVDNVTKINVFVSMFNKVISSRRFVIIHKIKKVNFVDVSAIVDIVVVKRSWRVLRFYWFERIGRIKSGDNDINQILQSNLLLLNEIGFLLVIRYIGWCKIGENDLTKIDSLSLVVLFVVEKWV